MPREMKNSGIAWIGEIPYNWNLKRLKFCSSFQQDKYSDNKGDLSYIGLENIVSWCGKLIETESEYDKEQSLVFRTNDILWGKLRPYLAKVYHATCDGCCSGEFCVIRIDKEHNARYFWNLLISSEFVSTVDRSTYGAKMPRANADFIKNIVVPIPPRNDQEKVADFLDTECGRIDAVMEQTRASIEEYKKLKQAIITEAVTKGIRKNRPMKDSGVEWIGEICYDWYLAKIKVGVTKVGSGKTPAGGAESYSEEGVLFLRSQNVYDTGLVLDHPTYITEEIDEEMKNTRVMPDDVLLNITGGSIGRCCIFPVNLGNANVNQHVSIIRVKKEVISPEFMHYYWFSKLGNMSIQLYQSGGNREGMTADAINNSPIPLPSISEQREIVEYLNKKCLGLDFLIEKKQQLLSEMELYKKSVIYEYVTGKKEVPCE